MNKHKKFELEDLPKSDVVNSRSQNEDYKVNKIINEVVTDHISSIVEEDISKEKNDVVEEEIDSTKSDKSSSAQKQEKTEAKEEETIKDNPEIEKPEDNKVELDPEIIKKEAYEQGVKETKAKYEKQMEDLLKDRDYAELLKQKLQEIVPEHEFDSEIAKISADAITGIAKKLHLILPADFEEIIRKGLLDKVKHFCKEGHITLTIHPDRYDFCKEVLQSDQIPSRFKKNFQIVQDDKLEKDDCSLECLYTRLEYNQEQLLSEIDKIIDQLKSAT
jgi:hypothetical protein